MHPDFDFGQLYDMTGGDAQIVSNLLVVIKKNLLEIPTEIEQLSIENNIVELCKKAHKFKSSIAYLGYDAFSDVLSQLELAIEENRSTADIQTLVEDVKKYATITLQEIELELEQIANMD